jgi:hypothetical protein
MVDRPKLFISYSWTTLDHEAWVENLASELVQNNIHVILDKWDLKEGQDIHAFMEQMVNDPTIKKVALICDQEYATKANERSGGVGTETQIITPEIYAKVDQQKFVAVLSERDEHGKPHLPTYYKSLKYIDLSDEQRYTANFEQLVRWVYDKPLHVRPEYGPTPDFGDDGPAFSLGTGIVYRQAMEAVRQGKVNAHGAVAEFFKTYATNMEQLRIADPNTPNMDEVVLSKIEEFTPFRNQAVELFIALAQYRQTTETYQLLHAFFEQLAPYTQHKPISGTVHPWQLDHYKFVVHELFLYCIAALLNQGCFDGAGYLLRTDYYMDQTVGRSAGTEPFTQFYYGLAAIEEHNKRQSTRWLSPHGALLQERATIPGVGFHDLTQADFVLFLRDCLDTLRGKQMGTWWPVTLVYSGRYDHSFPIFAKATSKEYFKRLTVAFDIGDKNDLQNLVQALESRKLFTPSWQGTWVPVRLLMNYDNLATRP